MIIACVPSLVCTCIYTVHSSQKSAKKKTLSRKRRQNENEGIHELASLVPLSSSQRSGLIPSNGGKPQTNSVLRLTTTFFKLQSFIKDGEFCWVLVWERERGREGGREGERERV